MILQVMDSTSDGPRNRPSSGPGYVHGHHASVLAAHGIRTAANSAAYLLPHLRPGMHILDVGCGPGTITLDLAAAVATADSSSRPLVVGVDNAPPAIEAARAEAARRGDVSTRFETADVARLPYEGGSFDAVHAHQVLQHLVDPVGALVEMARTVAPGGLIAVRDCDYGSMRWWPDHPGLDAWRDLYRALTQAHRVHCDAGRRLRGWARRAGLAEITVSASCWWYADEQETTWWADTWARRALESSFAQQARDLGLADDAQLARIAGAWREWGADPDAYFTMTHGEILARVT